MLSGPQVKICGLTRRADAEAAASAGADYVGVVFATGGPRTVDPERAAALLEGLPVRRVGVFVNATLAELRLAAEGARLDVLQLHGDETPEQLMEMRGLGRYLLWKAVRPRSGAEFLSAIERFAPVADGLLLDGWSARARGGTGERFPWEAVAEHRDRVPPELKLAAAGGLRPDNVARAVAVLRPDVVDISSGVELTPGVKDPVAVRAFVSAARGGYPESNDT